MNLNMEVNAFIVNKYIHVKKKTNIMNKTVRNELIKSIDIIVNCNHKIKLKTID